MRQWLEQDIFKTILILYQVKKPNGVNAMYYIICIYVLFTVLAMIKSNLFN